MVNLNTIKAWFKAGLYPTEQQFSATWDSFWHKSEKISVANIENLNDRFDEKADEEAFAGHLADVNAHNDLFNNKAEKNHTHQIDDVVGLVEALQDKQDSLIEGAGIQIIDNVISVVGASNLVSFGSFQVFKAEGNEMPGIEQKDLVRGFIAPYIFIFGQYSAGDTTSINSYIIFEQFDIEQPQT